MEEEEAAVGGDGGDGGGGGGGGGGVNSSSRASTSFVLGGDRQRFTVELRPGETTIVSWKKLVKDASKASGSNTATTSTSQEPPIATAHAALESRIPLEQSDESDLKDAPAPNRFSAVIEKIERLYMGKQSSDEEDLDDNPDDDQYDTEDSFIDDAELDEYFQVDNSAIKHNGFFVNRGQLERISEPTSSSPGKQPKKRRRKEEKNESHVPNKHANVGKKVAGKSTVVIEHNEDLKIQNPTNASRNKSVFDTSPSLKVPHGSEKDNEKHKAFHQSRNTSTKMKDARESDASSHKLREKHESVELKSQSARPSNNANGLELSTRREDKHDFREQMNPNSVEGKYAALTAKASLVHRKEGSSVRPKGTILEKAIAELEKMVAESRPPTMEAQDADNSSQAVKRRLPREVKQKLAKVARLAQASHGKIPKELINRLMSILGHLMQLRTLKRNLKIMVSMSLSASQEKDARFQQIKRDLVEMIKVRLPSLKSEIGSSDDFQAPASEKAIVERKNSMDNTMEDRICDLYDLYNEGLEEDRGPQIRKLYAELAELWPSGFMDKHGIKRAICRAKDRKRALYNRKKVRDQEKMRIKKMSAAKAEGTVKIEPNLTQPLQLQERLITDSTSHGLTPASRPTLTTNTIATKTTSPSHLDRPKQEKVKGNSSNFLEEAKAELVKKKVKRKPEMELGEAQIRLEKPFFSQQGEEKQKSHNKPTAAFINKNLHFSSAGSSFDQL